MLTEAPEEDLGDTLHQRSIDLLQATPNQENPQPALVIVQAGLLWKQLQGNSPTLFQPDRCQSLPPWLSLE